MNELRPVIAQKEFLALIFFFSHHGKDYGVIIYIFCLKVVKEKHNTGANPACHRSSSSPTLQAPKTARTLYKESHSDKRVKTWRRETTLHHLWIFVEQGLL